MFMMQKTKQKLKAALELLTITLWRLNFCVPPLSGTKSHQTVVVQRFEQVCA